MNGRNRSSDVSSSKLSGELNGSKFLILGEVPLALSFLQWRIRLGLNDLK